MKIEILEDEKAFEVAPATSSRWNSFKFYASQAIKGVSFLAAGVLGYKAWRWMTSDNSSQTLDDSTLQEQDNGINFVLSFDSETTAIQKRSVTCPVSVPMSSPNCVTTPKGGALAFTDATLLGSGNLLMMYGSSGYARFYNPQGTIINEVSGLPSSVLGVYLNGFVTFNSTTQTMYCYTIGNSSSSITLNSKSLFLNITAQDISFVLSLPDDKFILGLTNRTVNYFNLQRFTPDCVPENNNIATIYPSTNYMFNSGLSNDGFVYAPTNSTPFSMQCYSANFTLVGLASVSSYFPGYSLPGLRLESLENGGFIWGNNLANYIQAQRFDNDCNPVGLMFTVNNNPAVLDGSTLVPNNYTPIKIASLKNGGLAISWFSYRQIPSSSNGYRTIADYYCRAFDVNNIPLTNDTFIISGSDSSYDPVSLSPVALPDGGFAIAWTPPLANPNIHIYQECLSLFPNSISFLGVRNQSYVENIPMAFNFALAQYMFSQINVALTFSDRTAGILTALNTSTNLATSSFSTSQGRLFINGTDLAAVNQLLSCIEYLPSANYHGKFIVDIQASDTRTGVSAQTNIVFTGQYVVQAPILVNNSFSFTQGKESPITSSNLAATNVDINPDTLVFILIKVQNGIFQRTNQPGVAITRFSQAEVRQNQIEFVPDCSDVTPSFLISVSDGTLQTTPVSANINFVHDTTLCPTSSNNPTDTIGFKVALAFLGVVISGGGGMCFWWLRNYLDARRKREKHPLANLLREELNLVGIGNFEAGAGVPYLEAIQALITAFAAKGINITEMESTDLKEFSVILASVLSGYTEDQPKYSLGTLRYYSLQVNSCTSGVMLSTDRVKSEKDTIVSETQKIIQGKIQEKMRVFSGASQKMEFAMEPLASRSTTQNIR